MSPTLEGAQGRWQSDHKLGRVAKAGSAHEAKRAGQPDTGGGLQFIPMVRSFVFFFRLLRGDDMARSCRPRLEMLDLSQNRLVRVATLASSLPALMVLNFGKWIVVIRVCLTDMLDNPRRWQFIR